MKKVFYILNLLFLTLIVFGGSVFAAAPTEYINEKGTPTTITKPLTDLSKITADKYQNFQLTDQSWYYIDNNFNTPHAYLVETDADVDIVVNATELITLNTYAFFVPKGASLNFWAAPNPTEENTDEGVSLVINNSSYTDSTFIIGNTSNAGVQYWAGYKDNTDFGDITFNSGTYYIRNTNASNQICIGSPDSSGGSITVNSEAVVNASMQAGTGTAVGTLAENAGCTVSVSGGELNCAPISSNKLWTYGIDAGSGSVNISDLGKILASTNPEDLSLNIVSTGGIYGYATTDAGGTATSKQGIWNAVAGGGITVPVFDENGDTIVDTDFLDPLTGTYWNSFTVQPNGNLTLGAEDSEGELRAADFLVSGVGSVVNNNGTVNINAIDQTSGGGSTIYAPVIWNNNPGSTLTINEGTGSALTVYQLNNGDQGSSQQASTVNLYGTLQIGSGNITNEFNNYSQLNVGPIGQVATVNQNTGVVQNESGELINYAGGTVTSQNPCYYGNHFV